NRASLRHAAYSTYPVPLPYMAFFTALLYVACSVALLVVYWCCILTSSPMPISAPTSQFVRLPHEGPTPNLDSRNKPTQLRIAQLLECIGKVAWQHVPR